MKALRMLYYGLVILCLGLLVFAGCKKESAADAGDAAGPLSIKMADDGWPLQWHEAPTAAQAGIKTFGEAPLLAEQVKAGKLPPVEQRIPVEDALVIQSLDDNAVYGGTLRGARLSPAEYGDGVRAQIGYLFRCDPTMTEMVPYIAKGYSINAASDTLTIYLRRGARWSDGQPLTADDFMFLYDEVWNNSGMTSFWPSYPGQFVFEGKKSIWEKADDYTVLIRFPKPLSRAKIISLFNIDMNRYYFGPAHYLRQYIPKFNPDWEKLAKDEGFPTWQQMLSAHATVDPGHRFIGPELGPWITTSITDQGSTYERNPYFIAVDEKGRQLPYIDRFVTRYYTDSQVAILDAMQGNVDFVGRMLEPSNLPIYKENESRGNYTTYEWFSTKMAQIQYHFNFTYHDKVLRDIMRDVRFRRALSLAINRNEINQLVFLGLARPQQFTIDPGASFYQQGWDKLYAGYDPAEAKRLLAEMGLKAGNDGILLRPDGKPLEIPLMVSTESLVGPIGLKITELTAQYWREVGINAIVKQQETGLFTASVNNGDVPVYIYPSEDDLEVRSLANKWNYSIGKKPLAYAPEWGRWFAHEEWIQGGKIGAEPLPGEEPPAEIKEQYAGYLKYTGASNDGEYQEYARKFWTSLMDQLPGIGTVGNAPAPVIVTNRIKNVLPNIPFSFESFLWQTPTPYQWYIVDGKQEVP